jgi:hypothetical protein
MQLFFERVYTIDEWCAGPRAGVANFAGAPHFYRLVDLDTGGFELTPLSSSLFALMLEASALFHRWHPGPRVTGRAWWDGAGPPEDRARYAELARQIADGLATRHPIAIMRGHFDFDPDRVRWTPMDGSPPLRDISRN